jgi:hypothetical protein
MRDMRWWTGSGDTLKTGVLVAAVSIVVASCGSTDDPAPTATTLPGGTFTTTTATPSSTTVAGPPTTPSTSTTVTTTPSTTVTTTPSTTTTTMATNPIVLAPCNDPETCSHPMIEKALWDLPVLSIRFLPDADEDGIVDADSTGYNGTVDQLRTRIETLDIAGAWWMTESTRYRPTTHPGEPSLGYRIIDRLEFQTEVPAGTPVPWNEGWFRPDYMSILTGIDLCRWVDGRGVREIWMWTQHHGRIEPAESNMWSPVGDISNSERIDDLPACGHSYTVYNYNFTRGVAEMLHNHGHQAEALFGRGDPLLFWDLFVGGRTKDGGLVEPLRCGWTHTAPNGQRDYDTFNARTVTSDCPDWEPSGGPPSTVGCSTWFSAIYGDAACFDDGGLAFMVWWFQSLPGRDNGLSHDGVPLGNWWALFSDLESAIDRPSWLLESEAASA